MDPRQRAPFVHTSSSADLTQVLTPQRNTLSAPSWLANEEAGDRLDTDHLHPLNVIRRDTFRPSSPLDPFRLPTLTLPTLGTVRFVALCTLWYGCSALSSNTGKVILNHFKYPVTLTIVQFFFVAAFCVICSRKELRWMGTLKRPSRAILRGTLPMAAFQVGGHIFSSHAISRVPVSTVHTIKVGPTVELRLTGSRPFLPFSLFSPMLSSSVCPTRQRHIYLSYPSHLVSCSLARST